VVPARLSHRHPTLGKCSQTTPLGQHALKVVPRTNQSCWEMRVEANVGWAGQVRAVDGVISDQGGGVIPLRGRGSDQARTLPHSTAMYAIRGG